MVQIINIFTVILKLRFIMKRSNFVITMNFTFKITVKLLFLKKKHKEDFFIRLNFEQLLFKKFFTRPIFLPL